MLGPSVKGKRHISLDQQTDLLLGCWKSTSKNETCATPRGPPHSVHSRQTVGCTAVVVAVDDSLGPAKADKSDMLCDGREMDSSSD